MSDQLVTETVTVKYVNPPKGRGPANFKDEHGRYLKFWPERITAPALGSTIIVHMKVGEYPPGSGKPDYTVMKIGGDAPAAPASSPYREMTREDQRAALAAAIAPNPVISNGDATAERIFVCGIVNNAVAAKTVDPLAPGSIAECVEAARAAYKLTFGRT